MTEAPDTPPLSVEEQESVPPIRLARTLWVATAFAVVSVLGIGAAMKALVPDSAPMEALVTLLEASNKFGLVAGVGLMSLGMFFVALRWRSLIPGGQRLPAVGMGGVVCAGLLLNHALPGPVGELGAALLVKRRYGVRATLALAASVHARFIGLAVVGILATLVWLSVDLPVPPEHQTKLTIATALIAVGAVMLTIVSIFPPIIETIAHQSVGRLAGLAGRAGELFERLEAALVMLARSLREVSGQGVRRYGVAATFALLSHLSVAGGILLGAWSLGIDVYPPGILFTYCAATAAVLALIAFPGSQLGWDALLLAFLVATTGADSGEAFALVALVRIQQLLLIFVGAGALLFYGRERAVQTAAE